MGLGTILCVPPNNASKKVLDYFLYKTIKIFCFTHYIVLEKMYVYCTLYKIAWLASVGKMLLKYVSKCTRTNLRDKKNIAKIM